MVTVHATPGPSILPTALGAPPAHMKGCEITAVVFLRHCTQQGKRFPEHPVLKVHPHTMQRVEEALPFKAGWIALSTDFVCGAGEMARWIRALAALAEDVAWFPAPTW